MTQRNEPCPCGSGKKYKKCCLSKDVFKIIYSSDYLLVRNNDIRTKDKTLAPIIQHVQKKYTDFVSLESYKTFLSDYNSLYQKQYSEHSEQIYCQQGCNNCCYQPIELSTIEFNLINEYINNNNITPNKEFLPKQRDIINKTSLGQLVKNWRLELKKDEQACPFVSKDDGHCTIHPVRPLSCRNFFGIGTNEFCGAAPDKSSRDKVGRFANLAKLATAFLTVTKSKTKFMPEYF